MTGKVRPAAGPWLRSHGWAPARGVALAALSALGLLWFLLMAVAAGVGAGGLLLRLRALPTLRRRLAGSWSQVEIPQPYPAGLGEDDDTASVGSGSRTEDSRPSTDAGYRHGRRLYTSGRTARRKRRGRLLARDWTTRRDLIWLLLDPLLCAPLALLPALLVGAGLVGPWVVARWCTWQWLAPVAAVLGLSSVLMGFALGPWLLRLHGRWTRFLWSIGGAPHSAGIRWWAWLKQSAQGLGVVVLLCLLALAGLPFVPLQILALLLSLPLGFVPAFAWAVELGRRPVGLWRSLLRELTGTDLPAPYRPRPPAPAQRPDGHYAYGRHLHTSPILPTWLTLRRWVLTDPATWRDLLWLTVNPLVSTVLFLGPTALAALVVWWLPGWPGVLAAAPLAALALWLVPHTLRAQAAWSALLLAPTRGSQLASRVEQLTATREEASGVQAAELRRIERDLHDGAQTRLVAIGMNLRAIERRLDGASPELREMLAEARENSAAALADLRGLVRGVHPPVLAERGLADAVRSLALGHPLSVDVHVDLPGRPASPVAACAYFSVSEALTNAAKHADAEHVRIVLWHSAGALWITVTDDGVGGADPAMGSGLRGIQRRLATFDGRLDVASPVGGPTTLTMELPCVLSSARTSTSSEKG